MSRADIESQVSLCLSKTSISNQSTHDDLKNEVTNVLLHYNGLHPKTDTFTFNDGSRKELLCLRGTLPVPYRGDHYNIPVDIWILNTHPTHAPMCFVCPTSDMNIVVSQHVDQTGKIYLPYLHEWNAANSDIFGLIQMCIMTFGELPPVFAKPQEQQPSYYQPAAAAGSLEPQTSVTSDHIHASLVSAVEDKIRRALHEECAMKQVELGDLKRIKEDMTTLGRTLQTTLDTMQNDAEELRETSERMTAKEEELNKATKTSEEEEIEEIDVNELVSVQYPLYKQLLDAYAKDASNDDAIYWLGEALRRGAIDCDTFLKSVRDLARKQFFVRLTMQRCRKKANLSTNEI